MWRRRLTELRDRLVRIIQAALIAILLFLTYFTAMGLTALVWAPRRLLRSAPGRDESCWQPARGYHLSEDDTTRQS